MQLLLDRKYKKETYTIGKLYVDGVYFCDTCEDKDRGLSSNMSVEKIREMKKPGTTAIPTGTYVVDMNTVSPKYSSKPWYFINCNGARVPRLMGVPGFAGVLIHTGNTAKDSEGCILVGKNKAVGMVMESKDTFLKLYKRLYDRYKKGEKIVIVIKG